MQDRPTADELLESLVEVLSGPALEATEGLLKHQIRVAANLCRILRRELELGPAQEAQARQELAALLGVEDEGRSSLELAAALAERLLADDPDLERRAWPLLLRQVRGKLAIAKPGHDDYDFAGEL